MGYGCLFGSHSLGCRVNVLCGAGLQLVSEKVGSGPAIWVDVCEGSCDGGLTPGSVPATPCPLDTCQGFSIVSSRWVFCSKGTSPLLPFGTGPCFRSRAGFSVLREGEEVTPLAFLDQSVHIPCSLTHAHSHTPSKCHMCSQTSHTSICAYTDTHTCALTHLHS